MLRITIELFPFGHVDNSKVIATGKISQVIDDQTGHVRDYEAEFESDMDGTEFAKIKDHDRRNGPWELLKKLLNERV